MELETFKPHFVDKRWGNELWIANDVENNYCGKILEIKEGKMTSMHWHEKKHETFHVLEGTLEVRYIDSDDAETKKILVKEGESMALPNPVAHQLLGYGGDVKFIESSTYHEDSDSFRVHF